MEVVKAMVGHTTNVTEIYTHISVETMNRAMDRLENHKDIQSTIAERLRSADPDTLSKVMALLQ